MKLIQVRDNEELDVCLLQTDRDDDEVISDIEYCFEKAREIASIDRTIDVLDAAITYLEDENIWRIFADEAHVTLYGKTKPV